MSLLDALAKRYPTTITSFSVTLNTPHPHHKLLILSAASGMTDAQWLSAKVTEWVDNEWNARATEFDTEEKLEEALLTPRV